MAYQGINTGSSPNSETGDTLLSGGIKINENFSEVYTLLGDGTTLAPGIVTSILAGDNISVGSSTGQVTISASVGSAQTANVRSNTLFVIGVSTLGVVTGATYYGNGSNLTGLSTQLGQLENNVGFVTFTNNNQLANGAGYFSSLNGIDGSGLTGITTLISAGTNITLTTASGITTINSSGGGITTANVSANTLVVSGVSTLGVVTSATYYGDASNITSGKWNLGADSSTHYQFTGPGGLNATADPVIYLARGQKYEFVNNMGAHPFEIRVSNGGSAYTNGITVQGTTSNGTTTFDVPFDAPNSLYYQCTAHAGMGGTVVVYPDLFTV